MGRSEDFEVAFEDIVHETDKAFLIKFAEGEIWIPKSQVKDLDKDGLTVTIPEWLAVEKGLA